MRTSTAALAGAAVLAASVLYAGPAAAHHDVERHGHCSGPAHWELKARHEDGRIRVDGGVDSRRSGQTWRWRILHYGQVSARGNATTHGPSDSFEVRRLLVNYDGKDRIGWRARNTANGQTCRGRLRF